MKGKTKRKTLTNKLDKLWSARVRSGGDCEYCGNQNPHPHHVYGRNNKRLRWDLRNGCRLCFYCHKVWAHDNAVPGREKFDDWFERVRKEDAEYLAEENTKGTRKWTEEELREMINELSGQ